METQRHPCHNVETCREMSLTGLIDIMRLSAIQRKVPYRSIIREFAALVAVAGLMRFHPSSLFGSVLDASQAVPVVDAQP